MNDRTQDDVARGDILEQRRSPVVSVTIVNHCARPDLQRCLDSLRLHPYTMGEMELIVLDNASDDGSAEMVAGEYPEVTLMAERVRRGFGANQNRAIQKSRGDLVFVLNPDAVVHSHAIDDLVRALGADEQVAAVSGPSANLDGSLRQDRPHRFPTPISPVAKAAGLWRLSQLVRPQGAVSGWLSGGAFLIRRSAFDTVGGFDEGFFMYGEDADLFKRMQTGGLPIGWIDRVIVTHPHPDEPGEVSARREAEIVKGELTYMRKHHGHVGALLYRIAIVIDAATRVIVFSIPGLARLARDHGKSLAHNRSLHTRRLRAAVCGRRTPGLAELADAFNSHRAGVWRRHE